MRSRSKAETLRLSGELQGAQFFEPGWQDWQTSVDICTGRPQTWRVWKISSEDIRLSADQIDRFVSPSEKLRIQAMLPERAGVEFLEYRACLRLLLAGCLGQDAPDSIDIVIDPYGKPYLAAYPELHFNISHSHGLLLVAMAIAPVGVDIEYVREISDWHELSLHLFGAEQTRIIAALAEPMRSYTFLQHFTAQEAKIKALGHGFSGGGLAIVNTMTDCTYLMTVRLPDIPGYTSHLCITSG